jgi:hypothetical protein
MSNRHLDERIERLCQIEKKLGDIDQLTDLSLWRKTFKTLVAEGASVFCELDQFCWWCTTEHRLLLNYFIFSLWQILQVQSILKVYVKNNYNVVLLVY